MTKQSLGKTQHGDEWFDLTIPEADSLEKAIELASEEIEVVRAGLSEGCGGRGYWAQGPTKGTKVYGP